MANGANGLDWMWILIGAAIMVGLQFVGGMVVGIVLLDPGATDLGGVLWIIVAISLLSYGIGGFIVGVKSAGKTILEPGVSALIGVAVGLILQGAFTLMGFLIGGLIPFLAGILGGYLGEKKQGTI